MKIEKTFILEGTLIHYVITDNKCSLCRHNPRNYNPYKGYDGNCKQFYESVVECINYSSIND